MRQKVSRGKGGILEIRRWLTSREQRWYLLRHWQPARSVPSSVGQGPEKDTPGPDCYGRYGWCYSETKWFLGRVPSSLPREVKRKWLWDLSWSQNPPANAGDMGSIPGLGRSPGGGHGSPLQYSCLENPMDREAWWAAFHGVAKSWIRLNAWAYILSNNLSSLFKPVFILGLAWRSSVLPTLLPLDWWVTYKYTVVGWKVLGGTVFP